MRTRITTKLAAALLACLWTATADAETHETFAEPVRSIRAATGEPGRVARRDSFT